MPSAPTVPAAPDTATYTTSIADTPEKVRAAQRLRHQVFAGELGARFNNPAGDLDTDEFDELCDHLIVEHDPTGEVVGTYRLLPPGRGERLYSESEFDLSALDPLRVIHDRADGGGPELAEGHSRLVDTDTVTSRGDRQRA